MVMIKKQTVTSAGEAMEKLGPSHTTGGNVKLCSCCGKDCRFLKSLNRISMCPSNSIPRYTPERSENRCLKKALNTNVHSTAIQNNRKV